MKVIITGVESKLGESDYSLGEMGILKGEIYEVIDFENVNNGNDLPIIMSKYGKTAYLNHKEYKVIED